MLFPKKPAPLLPPTPEQIAEAIEAHKLPTPAIHPMDGGLQAVLAAPPIKLGIAIPTALRPALLGTGVGLTGAGLDYATDAPHERGNLAKKLLIGGTLGAATGGLVGKLQPGEHLEHAGTMNDLFDMVHIACDKTAVEYEVDTREKWPTDKKHTNDEIETMDAITRGKVDSAWHAHDAETASMLGKEAAERVLNLRQHMSRAEQRLIEKHLPHDIYRGGRFEAKGGDPIEHVAQRLRDARWHRDHTETKAAEDVAPVAAEPAAPSEPMGTSSPWMGRPVDYCDYVCKKFPGRCEACRDRQFLRGGKRASAPFIRMKMRDGDSLAGALLDPTSSCCEKCEASEKSDQCSCKVEKEAALPLPALMGLGGAGYGALTYGIDKGFGDDPSLLRRMIGYGALGTGLGFGAKRVGDTVTNAASRLAGKLPVVDKIGTAKHANDPIKKKIDVCGVPVHLEWLKGQDRVYKDKNGKETFRKTMKADYGYIPNTLDSDGEELDVYVGPAPEDCTTVYVINQVKKSGAFDEHKVMVGYKSMAEAKASYLHHMGGAKDRFGSIVAIPFKSLVALYGKPDTAMKAANVIGHAEAFANMGAL